MSHITGIIYGLKQQYGSLVTYVQISESTVDRSTGSKSIIKKAFDVDAVHLPASLMRKLIESVSFRAADKTFSYGGTNDYNSLGLLFTEMCFNPDLNGYIIWENQRYEKVSIDSYNNGEAYLMKVKLVEGGRAYDIIKVYANNTLELSGVLNESA